jgi:dynamin 1-like protein
MTQFARDFVTSIEGTNVDMSTKERSGGARIYFIFDAVFGHTLTIIEPTQLLEIQDIRTAIRNSTGPRPSLFVPEVVAFDLLVKPHIKLLGALSLRCIELVYEELVKICHNCTSTVRAIIPWCYLSVGKVGLTHVPQEIRFSMIILRSYCHCPAFTCT